MVMQTFYKIFKFNFYLFFIRVSTWIALKIWFSTVSQFFVEKSSTLIFHNYVLFCVRRKVKSVKYIMVFLQIPGYSISITIVPSYRSVSIRLTYLSVSVYRIHFQHYHGYPTSPKQPKSIPKCQYCIMKDQYSL